MSGSVDADLSRQKNPRSKIMKNAKKYTQNPQIRELKRKYYTVFKENFVYKIKCKSHHITAQINETGLKPVLQ